MSQTQVKVDVKVNDKVLKKKLDMLLDKETKTASHNALARIVDPWVPMLTGQLSQHTNVDETGVEYRQPYARYQYYGIDFKHTKDFHPLASAYWDRVALSVKKDELMREIEGILYRKLRQINGR